MVAQPRDAPNQQEPAMPNPAVIRPKIHHINLKTTRLQEMIDWYSEVVGTQVTFQDQTGAWLSNDDANHRVALLAFPGFVDDPERATRTGMHHSAFEYATFEDLNSSYLRLHDAGITPDVCLDHGMTLSYYYKDPDGNRVELQCDVFGDWARSAEWMRTSSAFRANPIGVFVDPARIADAAAAGETLEDIHRRAMAGEVAPSNVSAEDPAEG
jgi:catechol-2,3-dioxygenase